jgi:hypothetical protein
MKKNILTMAAMMFMTISMFAQWDIDEGFEGAAFPPTGWTVNNANSGDTWILNTNSAYSYTGSNSAGMPGSFDPADDWLISPQISVQIGDIFTFWARTHYTYSENFNVMLSTSGTAVEDFTVTLGSETIGWATYSEFEYDLSSYTGDVYLAIQCVTIMTTGLFVDDVKVGQDEPAEIYIPADYPTIQEGLNAANTLTTVIVSAGTYYENIEWPDTDGIILLSETGATNTIIDGSGQNRVIYIPEACTLTNETVIDGFTIQNGHYSGSGPHPGGGIADYCGLTIRNNIIKNNFAQGLGGGLIVAGGTPLIFNNLIIDNTSDDAAGGLCVSFCVAEIRNNTIVGNSADNGSGGGGIVLFWANGTVVIEDNIIVNNSADGSSYGGGGIFVSYSGCSLNYNDCWGNTPDNYAGCSAGSNSISADPVFVDANNQNYFLDQAISPCIDAGSQTAFEAGLNNYTTSYELILDIDQVDIGYHYNPDDFIQTNVNDYQVLPIETLLLPNYPNPFSQSTVIGYRVPVSGKVVLKVYDMLGQEVQTLVDKKQAAGKHLVVWDGTDNSGNAVVQGIYFYQLRSEKKFSEVKKMMLLK